MPTGGVIKPTMRFKTITREVHGINAKLQDDGIQHMVPRCVMAAMVSMKQPTTATEPLVTMKTKDRADGQYPVVATSLCDLSRCQHPTEIDALRPTNKSTDRGGFPPSQTTDFGKHFDIQQCDNHTDLGTKPRQPCHAASCGRATCQQACTSTITGVKRIKSSS